MCETVSTFFSIMVSPPGRKKLCLLTDISLLFQIQGSVRKVRLSVNIVQFPFEIRCFVPRFEENPQNSPMKSKRLSFSYCSHYSRLKTGGKKLKLLHCVMRSQKFCHLLQMKAFLMRIQGKTLCVSSSSSQIERILSFTWSQDLLRERKFSSKIKL